MAVAFLFIAYFWWDDPLRLRSVATKKTMIPPIFAIALACLTVAFVVRDAASYVEACSSILGKH